MRNAIPPPPRRQIQNQANFCEGTYALCIKAACSGIPTLDRLGNYVIDRALCACDVMQGVSMGPGSCQDRAPVTQQGRTYLISTYSNRYNDSEPHPELREPENRVGLVLRRALRGRPERSEQGDLHLPGDAERDEHARRQLPAGRLRRHLVRRCRRPATSSPASTSIGPCSSSIRACRPIRPRRCVRRR